MFEIATVPIVATHSGGTSIRNGLAYHRESKPLWCIIMCNPVFKNIWIHEACEAAPAYKPTSRLDNHRKLGLFAMQTSPD